MANFEENVEEMVGTTREAVAVATESGGDETEDETGNETGGPGARPGTRRRRQLVTRRRRPVG